MIKNIMINIISIKCMTLGKKFFTLHCSIRQQYIYKKKKKNKSRTMARDLPV